MNTETVAGAVISIAQYRSNRIRNAMELRDLAALAIRDSKQKYKDIAAKVGVWPNTIGRLASGDTREPRCSTVINVLLALGYSVSVSKD